MIHHILTLKQQHYTGVILLFIVLSLLTCAFFSPPRMFAAENKVKRVAEPQPVPSPLARTFLSTTTLSLFGIETNTGRISRPKIHDYARQLGTNWLRINTVSWLSVQPDPERVYQWEALETFEQEVLAAHAANLEPMVVIDDHPAWATIPYTDPNTGEQTHARCGAIASEHFADFAAFVGELVSRYKDPPFNVRYWELGNEPDVAPELLSEKLQNYFGCWGDISDPYYGGRHYGAMLSVVAPAIRAADPTAQILIGGLALDTPETTDPEKGKPEKFFEGILRAGAADHFDIVGFHVYPWYVGDTPESLALTAEVYSQTADLPPSVPPYPHNRTATVTDYDLEDERWAALGGATYGKVRYLRGIMEQYGIDKPLFLNETALITYPPHSEAFYKAQAEHLVRQVVRAAHADVGAYVWYTLHESGWLSAGLLDRKLRPRPAYESYRHLLRQLRGSKRQPARLTEHHEAIEAYRFDKGSSMVEMFWTTDGVARTVERPADQFVSATRHDGSVIIPQQQGQNIAVPVDSRPIFLQQRYPPPLITGASPAESEQSQITTLTISGTGFLTGSTVLLGDYPLRNPVLVESKADHTRLQVSVPPDVPPALYNLTIINPDGQTSVLPNRFSVLAPQPALSEARPAYGQTNLSDTFNIYGHSFQEGCIVKVGTMPFTTTRINATHLQVSLPSFALPAGPYDLTVTNPDGMHDILPEGYTVYAASDDDLLSHELALWTEPSVPRAGQATRLGLTLSRQGGTHVISDVVVRFYEGTPQAEGAELGSVTLPSLAPGTTTTTTTTTASIAWTPTTEGPGTISAVLDATDVLSETDEYNNVVHRTIVVAPAGRQRPAPRIDRAIVRGGGRDETATTARREVVLDIDLSETEGTQVLLQEYAYSRAARAWLPVQHSGWMRHTRPLTYLWRLTPAPGIKYLHVWAADGSGNITPTPTRLAINLLPSSFDRTYQNHGRVYRYHLGEQSQLTARIDVRSGDPDIYLWQRGNQSLLAVNNQTGPDTLDVVIPQDDEYQIEVRGYQDLYMNIYGYDTMLYRLRLAMLPFAETTRETTIYRPQPDPYKVPCDQPLIPLTSEPGTAWAFPDVPISSDHHIYLPSVQRVW